MLDLIQEIYGTIRRNKLRTALTGLSVAWGIFMLIVLLGAGNGILHAFEGQSGNMKMNSIKIFPGYTDYIERRRPEVHRRTFSRKRHYRRSNHRKRQHNHYIWKRKGDTHDKRCLP